MQNRIKEIRKTLGMTQQEFADRLGIKRTTIGNYEAGRNDPVDAVISLICDRCNVNEKWLRTGDGEMFRKIDEFDEFYRLADQMLYDETADFKRRLITALLKLDPEQINRAVNWMLETFRPVQTPADSEPKEPTIDEKVAAYRAELEAQEAIRKSEATPNTREKEA